MQPTWHSALGTRPRPPRHPRWFHNPPHPVFHCKLRRFTLMKPNNSITGRRPSGGILAVFALCILLAICLSRSPVPPQLAELCGSGVLPAARAGMRNLDSVPVGRSFRRQPEIPDRHAVPRMMTACHRSVSMSLSISRHWKISRHPHSVTIAADTSN